MKFPEEFAVTSGRPLMCHCCGRPPLDRDHPVLQRLLEVSATISSVTVAGIDMSGPTAAVTGWEALRDVLHSRGVRSREDLAEQIHSMGFPMPLWDAHFSGRAQERILGQAIAVDARVSGLESLFVRLTLAGMSQGRGAFSSSRRPAGSFRRIPLPGAVTDHMPCWTSFLRAVGPCSMMWICELCSRNGSRRCRVVHSTSEEGFDWHAARHWKQDAMRPILGTS